MYRKYRNKEKFLGRVEQSTLRWFGCVERIEDGKITRGFIGQRWMESEEGKRWRGEVGELVKKRFQLQGK